MQLKKYLSLLLMLVFLTPVVIQATHIFFIHHHHAVNKQKAEINQSFDKCSICSYEFVEFINSDNSGKQDKPLPFVLIYTDTKHDVYVISSIKLLSLRAPPLNSYFIS